MTQRVVLATHNEHKVHELQQILGKADLGLEIVSMAAFPEVGEIPETEVTFAGNARLKAEHVAMRTSLPALADDSGLAVEVLGGSPHRAAARDGKKIANVIPVDHGAIRHRMVRLPSPHLTHRTAIRAAIIAYADERGPVPSRRYQSSRLASVVQPDRFRTTDVRASALNA